MTLVTRATDGVIESEPPSGRAARKEFAPRRRSDGAGELIDSRGTGIVLGELSAAARPRIAEILRGSRVFSAAEIDVALELFDESREERGTRNEEGRLSLPKLKPTSSFLVPHSSFVLPRP